MNTNMFNVNFVKKNVNIKINGKDYVVPEGSTILEAARMNNIRIPTLCYIKEINEIGACRMCVVEVTGAKTLVAACVNPVSEGMEIFTNSKRVLNARRMNLQLLLSNHDRQCLSCVRSYDCELQKLCREYGIEDEGRFDGAKTHFDLDTSAIHMVRDNNKCVFCHRCVSVCEHIQGVGVIGPNKRGFESNIGTAFNMGLGETACVGCGQCILVCPTGALHEKDSIDEVFTAINDPDKYVVVQTAPAVRAALGEGFGLPIGTCVEGKMITALRMLGFDKVFDTNFAADLTIMEEANEFLERMKSGVKLPLITSCSPGWVNYCEHYHPEFIPNLSSCKSPQQMFGAITKSYFAEKAGIPKEKIVMVSIMPCTAKKMEIRREDEAACGVPDVDIALTTRELIRMIRRMGLKFEDLADGTFDDPLGESTGAGVIFGSSGGVMEAALRSAAEKLTGKELSSVDFHELRGFRGIKEASYNINGVEINVCVVSGLANADKVLNMVKNGSKNYHFIEIMCCPGGCINGGGQPRQTADTMSFVDVKGLRAKALYELDQSRPHRKSHENPAIIKLYEELLGEPGSIKAHQLLHTSYSKKPLYKH